MTVTQHRDIRYKHGRGDDQDCCKVQARDGCVSRDTTIGGCDPAISSVPPAEEKHLPLDCLEQALRRSTFADAAAVAATCPSWRQFVLSNEVRHGGADRQRSSPSHVLLMMAVGAFRRACCTPLRIISLISPSPTSSSLPLYASTRFVLSEICYPQPITRCLSIAVSARRTPYLACVSPPTRPSCHVVNRLRWQRLLQPRQ